MAEPRHVQLIPAIGWVAVFANGSPKPPYSENLEDLIWTSPVIAWAIVAERMGPYADDPEATRLTGVILDATGYHDVPDVLRELDDDENQLIGYFPAIALNDQERLKTLRLAAINQLERMEARAQRAVAKQQKAKV